MFRIWQSTHRMLIRHDPLVGHRYIPNLIARIPNELGGSYVRTNAQGFRSNLDFQKERSGKKRILFFGDSYTAGDLCSNEERFAELVGERFDAEVYNFGISGTGTDQQLLILESFAKGIEADLIVLAVYSENIERNKVRSRITIDRTTGKKVLIAKPYFTLENGQLAVHQVPVPFEHPEVQDDEEVSAPFGSHKLNPRLRLLFRALDFFRYDKRMKTVRKVLGPMMEKLRPLALRATCYQPFPDYKSKSSEGWLLMEAILRRFIASARPNPVLIVPLPAYHNFKWEVKPIFQPFFDTLNEPSKGVHVIDVTRPMGALPRERRLQIPFKEDNHFSPTGHRITADLISQAIEERGLLPKSAPARKPADLPKPKPTYVLGISAFYHNSAAALIVDGKIIAASEEERFTRVKNDRRFPHSSINFCLEEAHIHQSDLAAVIFYDNASLTFERLMHTQAAIGSRGTDNWVRFLPSWTLYKLHIPKLIRDQMKYDGLILQDSHHRSHAASAFYPSPFQDAAILTIDGVGEWATAAIGVGEGSRIRLLKEMHFPNSLGLLYSAFTQFTGFKVNSGEYKMMGLAPYGKPKYVQKILENLVNVKEDGSIELNMEYFAFLDERRMTNEKFAELFGGPARPQDELITEREIDLASSIQFVTEEAMLRMAQYAKELTGKSKLCMAGGVALNCVANGRIRSEGPFEEIWIQPAAGDAGGSLGCALDAYYTYFEKPRAKPDPKRPEQGLSLFGPSFTQDEIKGFLESNGYPYHPVSEEDRANKIAEILKQGKVVGHFAGRCEFGPRALGARSIIGDARNTEMQVTLNLKIKYRESFRPFAPSVLEENVSEYFQMTGPSPYMLLVAPVNESRRLPIDRHPGENPTDIVKRPRSDLPAITHIDYSARVQTVNQNWPIYYELIHAFQEKTGYAVIVNTSFNLRGEPIVLTPYDAYRCFMRTEMDVLVLEKVILYKSQQPAWPEAKGHVEFDVTTKRNTDNGLTNKLLQVFREQFLTVAEKLAREKMLKIAPGSKRRKTTWVDTREPEDLKQLFRIQPALDAMCAPDPHAMAEALLANWTPKPAAEQMRSVIVSVLKIGIDNHPTEEIQEEVADSVYVMF